MIDLYTWNTPNGRKISIMLEETGLAYRVNSINIMKDEQFAPEFLKISPNNKIPAIVDNESEIAMMESGAILLYLAQKTGMFLPEPGPEYWRTIEWLMFQVGGAGPMLGQAHHFVHFKPEVSDYARQRYSSEAKRLYGVMERRLAERDFIAGNNYSIADIAIWPWITRFDWQDIQPSEYPAVFEWYARIAARPAVQRGYRVPDDLGPIPVP